MEWKVIWHSDPSSQNTIANASCLSSNPSQRENQTKYQTQLIVKSRNLIKIACCRSRKKVLLTQKSRLANQTNDRVEVLPVASTRYSDRASTRGNDCTVSHDSNLRRDTCLGDVLWKRYHVHCRSRAIGIEGPVLVGAYRHGYC